MLAKAGGIAGIKAGLCEGTWDAAEDCEDEVPLQGPRHSRAGPGSSRGVPSRALPPQLVHHLHVYWHEGAPSALLPVKSIIQHLSCHVQIQVQCTLIAAHAQTAQERGNMLHAMLLPFNDGASACP